MREPADIEARLQKLIIPASLSIAAAMEAMDRAGFGILLICGAERRLEGVLTDGDIRKAILRGDALDQPCGDIASRSPIIATDPVSPAEALDLMDNSRSYFVNQLPVLNAGGQVVDLVLRSDLIKVDHIPMSAVVMAGGEGTRLRPLTDSLPKPMLPVGDRPLLEIIIQRLRAAGIQNVNVTTHYKSEKIADYFGDGQKYGVDIRYINEETPLGTAGGLSLIETPKEPLLVINGDILTRVDFRAMLSFHRQHDAALTIGVRAYNFQVPYGVIECDGPDVRGVREKPVYSFFVNAGVYLLEPEAHQMIPAGQHFDMTDLMAVLLAQGKRVVSFPIVEYWQDIGQHTDYEQVQRDVQDGRVNP
ncbi:MAG TPA: nucleotidyltransferase family protein [Anaerolineaceae bacterium]